MTNVYITKYGVISALGSSPDQHFSKLQGGETGIFASTIQGKIIHRAHVPFSNEELAEMCHVPYTNLLSRTALLGLFAAQKAWKNQTYDAHIKTAFINGSTVGGMDRSETFFKNQTNIGQEIFSMHDLGSCTSFIAKNISSFDRINTISTACSSSANAIMIGAQLIKTGRFDRVLVGGSDALCEFTFEGFTALMVHSADLCMPFDRHRKGLNLGEGSAYLLLESEKSIRKTTNKPLSTIIGWGNSNDAFHNTGTSANGLGAQMAMKKALNIAQLSPLQIDYVNAHGTATKNNDSSEMAALNAVFDNNVPSFSSTKGATGHTLAASGAIEAVFSLMAIQANYAYKNLNIKDQMDNSSSLLLLGKNKPISTVLSNSFGFGGNSTSLIFSTV